MRKMSGGDAPHQPPSARRATGSAVVTLSGSRSRRGRTRGRWRAPRRSASASVAHVGRHAEIANPVAARTLVHALPRMIGGQVHLAGRGVEAEDAERGDHRGGPAARESDPRAPARAVAEAGRGDEVHALAEAVLLLRHDHHEAPGQARDVGAAAAAGQPDLRPAPVADIGRVQVAEPVDLGAADEAQVHQPLLEQRHDLERARAPEGARDVRRVAHGHQRLGRRLIAHDAVLEEPDGPGRVRALGEGERDQRQAHAHEDDVAVADLAARPR